MLKCDLKWITPDFTMLAIQTKNDSAIPGKNSECPLVQNARFVYE